MSPTRLVASTTFLLAGLVPATASAATPPRSLAADTILHGGKVVALDGAARPAQAVAIRQGRIVAVGRDRDVARLAGTRTRTVNLDGRTVIPGLVDSHLHAIRAGLTYGDTLIRSDADVRRTGRLERDAAGQPTGRVFGDVATLASVFARIPGADAAGQLRSTAALFRDLCAFGLTGLVDGAGGGLLAPDYQPVTTLWRQGRLRLRVAYYYLNGQTPGRELEDLKALTQFLPGGFGDDMLKFGGLGERVIIAANDSPLGVDADEPFVVSEAASQALYGIALWAAQRRLPIQLRASTAAANAREDEGAGHGARRAEPALPGR